MNRNFVSTFICVLFFAAGGLSQPMNSGAQERIEARKIAFISDKLALSPSEAQDFWPLYNAFQKERSAILQKYKIPSDLSLLSDQEVEEYVEKELEKEANLLALKRSFTDQIKEVLPIRKVAKLSRVEKRFREWMLQRIRERKGKK